MTVLITGSNGQLGSEIRQLTHRYKFLKFIFKDLPELDICNFKLLNSFIHDNNIKVVINCAAYTAVDKAEEYSFLAKKVNSDGVNNIIKALQLVKGKLIHISTDYVFSGDHFLPYKESDSVSPVGVYGKTKRGGELAVINSKLDAIVIRTSWLYSSFGNNFVKTMINLGKEKKELGVVFDQVGTPTYAKDLATTCLDILRDKSLGEISAKGKIYHYSNEGVTSWYDFAKTVMELANLNCQVNPVHTKDYHSEVKRPHFSVLDKSKIKTDFDVNIPYWRDSLKVCISILKNK